MPFLTVPLGAEGPLVDIYGDGSSVPERFSVPGGGVPRVPSSEPVRSRRRPPRTGSEDGTRGTLGRPVRTLEGDPVR